VAGYLGGGMPVASQRWNRNAFIDHPGGRFMFPSTWERVRHNTSDAVNQRIRSRTERTVAECIRRGRAAIERRLAELEEEWDIERYLETMAPTFTLIGLALGVTTDRRWLILPAAVQTFFLQHALQGWCPPVPVLRRLGIRTADEINVERYALKALRGDFESISGQMTPGAGRVKAAFAAIE
jgi:hypothetical protein